MTKNLKIAVVGGGLMGRLLSWQLKLSNPLLSVELFEKQPANSQQATAYTAAAMLAPLAESIVSGPLVSQLGQNSVHLWQALIQALPEPVFIQQAGTLVVAHHQDRGDLQSFCQRIAQHGTFETLNRTRIEQLEPQLANRFHQGVWLANEGQLDNRHLLTVLQRAMADVGVVCHFDSEVSINGREVCLAHNRTSFDYLIDCRGMGAKANLGTLRGVRGEVARVRSPEVKLNRPIRLMHPRYPIYIAPKPFDEYVIGATEIESQSDKGVTVRSALELLSAAYSIHPAFAEAELISLKAGLRPTLPNNEPCIEYDSEGALLINGLYRHGYLLAPAILQQALLKLKHLGVPVKTPFIDQCEICLPLFRCRTVSED